MPELKHEVKVYKVNYVCDDCSTIPNPGCVLELAGYEMRMTNPPHHRYACPNCHREYWLPRFYPAIEYEDISDRGW